LPNGSGVSREAPAPFCERPEGQFLWPTHHGQHWSLDVGFREDRQVAHKMNQAENLAVLRRIAFTLLKQEKSALSLENKRMKAAMSEEYLDQVLRLNATEVW